MSFKRDRFGKDDCAGIVINKGTNRFAQKQRSGYDAEHAALGFRTVELQRTVGQVLQDQLASGQ